MKRLTLFTLIAIFALVSVNADAKNKRVKRNVIPFEKLVAMIATEAHWNENNVAKLGLRKLLIRMPLAYKVPLYELEKDEPSSVGKNSWDADLLI